MKTVKKNPVSMTMDKIYAGIQLDRRSERHFLTVDNNSERSLNLKKRATNVYIWVTQRLQAADQTSVVR